MGGSGGVRECERVHACVRDVFAIYDNDILPRLIRIIIKIIILYFIQIRHTDDFSYTGTRLVLSNIRNRRFPRSMRSQGERPGCGSHVKRVDHGDTFNA